MIYMYYITHVLHISDITRIKNSELWNCIYIYMHVQSVIAWLQSRYVGYYERVKKDLGGQLPPETKKRITSVKIEGLEGQYMYFGL